MSVSLDEVLTGAGYDIKNNYEDAQWFLSQIDNFDELCESANDCVEKHEYEELMDEEDE